ncbi:uncharacterized protein LOC142231322 [Haematobia irritans]|uniref:uncharacterized protein LOC142231322 n=1 Tax=Haematobia irritans TaxID=7368 RepID=UPI003F50A778
MEFNDDYLCPLCISRHSLRTCRRFLALPPLEKRAFIRDKDGCTNCLALSHGFAQCTCKAVCWECAKHHHTFLHPVESDSAWVQMTAWVVMWTPRAPQEHLNVRAMLDPNVMTSYYTPTPTFPLAWEKCDDILPVRLWGMHNDVRTVSVDLVRRVQPAVRMPAMPLLPYPIRAKYGTKNLADHGFHIPYPCSVVLGADVAAVAYLGLPRREKGLPFTQDTIFGRAFFWINED